jgi:ParB family chromosome partitioning protein
MSITENPLPVHSVDKSDKSSVRKKKRGLGRGLEALLQAGKPVSMKAVTSEIEASEEAVAEHSLDASSSSNSVTAQTRDADSGNFGKGKLQHLPLESLKSGQYQPRKEMDRQSLEELADSIKRQGIMQPIVVRSMAGQQYEIIAGERRWRAAQIAGLDKIPALIREVPDEAAIAMALIENLQREDLHPIEEAQALHRLQLEFELTQQEVAEAVGKSRVAVTHLLRLLKLELPVRTLLENGDIDAGHAKALLGLENQNQIQAAEIVVARGLNVRQTEALVKNWSDQRTEPVDQRPDPNIQRLERVLGDRLGAAVSIRHQAGGRGKLIIGYSSLDELDGILDHIK